MKTSNKIIFPAIFLCLSFLIPEVVMAQANLNGTWKCNQGGIVMMMEINGNTLTIDGNSATFKLEGNNMLVYEGDTFTIYPYTHNGNTLTLTFPGGMKLAFLKEVADSPVQTPATEVPQSIIRPSTATATQAEKGQSLTGRWSFSSQQGELILEFQSASQLTFNGESTQYQLQPGIIQAMGDNGWINYPFRFSEGKLIITFPDGTQVPFTRIASPVNQGVANNNIPGGTGNAGSLSGSLCYWSGSSGSSSSYSRTEKISFDGRGNFTYSREGSFSGDAGIAYSGNPNANRGTYRIDANFVYLQFQSGETIKVEIALRANNGRITALKYEGKLYAAELCD